MFYQKGDLEDLPPSCFRKRQSLGVRVVEQITAFVNLFRMRVHRLSKLASPPSFEFDHEAIKSYQHRPEDLARFVREQWRVGSGAIDSVTDLFEDHGVVVVVVNFGDVRFDGLSIYDADEDGPPIIFVSSEIPGDRMRFTLCHELAHVLLHHWMALPPKAVEKEADRFAAEFLMPEKDVRKDLEPPLTLKRLMTLKREWKVAMSALIYRAATLGTITERQKRYLYTRMSSLGYRKTEPVQTEREEPQLLSDLLQQAIETPGFTRKDLRLRLFCTDQELEDLGLPPE